MDYSAQPQPQPQRGYEYLQQPQAQPYSTNTENKMDYSSSYPPQPQQGYEYLQQPQAQAQTQAQEVYQHQYSLDSTQPQTYDPSQSSYYHCYPYDQKQQYPYYPPPPTLTHNPISDPPPRQLFPITQNPYRGGRSGRPSRGRGRVRGRQISSSLASLPRQPQPSPQPQLYYCEVCVIGCNSREILEMHNNGKKHKKKLQELDRASHKSDPQVPENNAEGDVAVVVDNPNRDEDGNKRKSMAGKAPERGGKNRRLGGEEEKAAPLLCELCDVKCNTRAVFDIHLNGKKHRSKVKKLGLQRKTVALDEDPQVALARLLRTYAASNVQLDPDQLKCLVDLCNGAINSVAAAVPVESVEQVPDQPQEDKTQ